MVMHILFSSSMFAESALLAQMNVVTVTPDDVDRFRCARQLRANLRVGGRLKACRAVLNTMFGDPDYTSTCSRFYFAGFELVWKGTARVGC